MLEWYDAARRPLPWRATKDPYAIWVSEIMLQQTRVEAVIGYYERFLHAFPTVGQLAAAPEEAVLALWSGLGYYSRARNLHRGAAIVADRPRGEFPREWNEARALPGIGDYTAAAILSIAYGARHAVVDGNVARVLARLGRLDPPADQPRALARLAERLLDPERAGDFNQAMMELGATVCTPRAPRCNACPVSRHCLALSGGVVDAYPKPKKRRESVEVRGRLLLVRDGMGRLLLTRGRWRLLPSLWIPPVIEDESDGGSLEPIDVLASLGIDAARGSTTLGTIRHSITHHKIALRVLALTLQGTAAGESSELLWSDDERLERLGRSSLLAKALRLESARRERGDGLFPSPVVET